MSVTSKNGQQSETATTRQNADGVDDTASMPQDQKSEDVQLGKAPVIRYKDLVFPISVSTIIT